MFGWIIILGDKGLLNRLLLSIGLDPVQLMYTDFAVVMGLVHVLLPYAVLPLLASMRSLPVSQMRAASSLGAAPMVAFFRIYLPQIS